MLFCRIGPLGYAFVNFESVADAARAYDALNNVVVPLLTGTKQLKMRFKPAKVGFVVINQGRPEHLPNLSACLAQPHTCQVSRTATASGLSTHSCAGGTPQSFPPYCDHAAMHCAGCCLQRTSFEPEHHQMSGLRDWADLPPSPGPLACLAVTASLLSSLAWRDTS